MAACDNLYVDQNKWIELFEFLSENKPEYLIHMKKQPNMLDGEIRICYIADIQKYLYDNCPLEWVKEDLKDNFMIQKAICGKAHHE